MARNVLSGRSSEVRGLKELLQSTSSIIDATTGPQLVKILQGGGKIITDQAKSNAQSQGWPSKAANSFFTYGNAAKIYNNKPNALAGLVKKESMVEWRAGKHPKSPNAKVAPGGKVAMALATMYEYGTSRQAAKPAFRPAIASEKSKVYDHIRTNVTQLIADTAAKNAVTNP